MTNSPLVPIPARVMLALPLLNFFLSIYFLRESASGGEVERRGDRGSEAGSDSTEPGAVLDRKSVV